jgi:hypothetical protein
LFTDEGGEIDLVMRWPDAGSENGDEIGRLAAEVTGHRYDGLSRDVQFGALLAGVEKADGAGAGIEEGEGPAVGDVDAEEEGVPGDEGVDTRGKDGRVRFDGRDPVAVDLPSEVGLGEAETSGGGLVVGLQMGEGGGLFSGGADLRDAFHEIRSMVRRGRSEWV